MTAIPRSEVRYFNPRIPYGMRLSVMLERSHPVRFQSTHPVWDATRQSDRPACGNDFNPRIPYGMRRAKATQGIDGTVISIHASRMGCDWSSGPLGQAPSHFNPRIPYGMRRDRHTSCPTATNFNPRIPYGMRPTARARTPTSSNFNPRIPYGMRLQSLWTGIMAVVFQSTHPVWDATVRPFRAQRCRHISIHASRMGCDLRPCPSRPAAPYFNPRIPYGMRRWTVPSSVFSVLFQSTHPVWDATWAFFDWGLDPAFQSTHPVWDATWEQHESDCHG